MPPPPDPAQRTPIGIASPSGDVRLREIVASDNEALRTWKNRNRHAFFFQEVITPEMQDQWFAGYLQRPDDHMFIVELHDGAVGCMGYRIEEGKADVYNVILGDERAGGKGIMGRALLLLCGHILSRIPGCGIGAKVLKTNPAVRWYLRNGFRRTSEQETHYELELATDLPGRDMPPEGSGDAAGSRTGGKDT